MATLAEFLQRALVWPDPDKETGWVNLHWRRPGGGITGGQAFKKLEDVLGFIVWAQSKGKGYVSDLYFCTSLQKEHGDPKQNGRYTAVRSIDNAVSSKLLFADVDKYPSKFEALEAIVAFCRASASPHPTAVVDSGGGLHSYWMLPEPLQKDEWLETAARFDGLLTAHGLKHDNISTDMARILRPPETLNYKRNPLGDPVVLKLLNGDIDLQTWKSLLDATPVVSAVKPGKVHHATDPATLFVDPAVAQRRPSTKFAGLVKPEDRTLGGTLDPQPIIKQCPMFAKHFEMGGEEVSQPIWHQEALACTFIDSGRELFHELSWGHKDYSREATDAMFDRKLRDRFRIGLGYPSCSTFEKEGAVQCATCPLKGQITSPLNIRPDMSEKQVQISDTPISQHGVQLPDPLNGLTFVFGDVDRGEDPDLIYGLEGGGKGKPPLRTLLLGSKIVSQPTIFRDEKGMGVGLRVRCTSDLGRIVEIAISPGAFEDASASVYKEMSRGGAIVVGNPSKLTSAMLGFRKRMAHEAKAQRMTQYGWVYDDAEEGKHQGVPTGFAYSGKIYEAANISRDTGQADEHLATVYQVSGELAPWLAAARMIIDMKSPGLQALVLSALAAPLMIFSKHPSTVVMVRGDTGGSKSTALQIACAVWAQPRRGILKPNSSKLGMMKRMGLVRHLPTFWDDIRDDMFETVRATLMEITQGAGGLKLDANRKEREQEVWDSMLVTSSNDSLAEYLESVSKNSGASLVRCYEFQVPKIVVGGPGYMDSGYVAGIVGDLEFNFGHIGREYASVLGAAPSELQEVYKQVAERIAKQVAPYQPFERYWMAAAATILTAGLLANTRMPSLQAAGVKFDLAALEKFLVETFWLNRERHSGANVAPDSSRYVKTHLSAFINVWAARQNEVVWTIDKPRGVGKPAAVAPRWPIGEMLTRVRSVSVRWVITDRKLFVSKVALDRFLKQEKISTDRMRDGLVKFYGAKINYRGRMASGLIDIAAQGQEAVYEIDVRPSSWLDDMLMQHVTASDFQGSVYGF